MKPRSGPKKIYTLLKNEKYARWLRKRSKKETAFISMGDDTFIFGGKDREHESDDHHAEHVFLEKLPVTFPGTIYLLGGEFGLGRDMSYGPLTIEMLKQFNFDLAFLSTNGIDLERKEVSVFDFQVGAVKKKC